MGCLCLTLSVLLAQVPAPPAELAPPPSTSPLRPAPAAVAPAAPEAPTTLQPASPPFEPRIISPAVTPAAGQLPEQSPAPPSQIEAPKAEETPAVPATPPPAQEEAPVERLAEQLWQIAMESADPAAFQAERRTLLDALRTTNDTATQTAAVKAYWRLSVAIVKYGFSEEESVVLGQAPEPQLPHEKALLAAARAAALARQQDLQIEVISAQYDLTDRTPSLAGRTSPWCADVPLTGRYRTNLELLFAGRVAPASLVRIDKSLPPMLDALNGHAEAVAASSRAVQQVAQAYASGQTSLRELLDTVNNWREQRAAFAAAVLRYNERIADYALTVMGPMADPATVVSTLIYRRPANAVSDAGVQQASATEPVASEGDGPVSQTPPVESPDPPAASIGSPAPPEGPAGVTPAEPGSLPQSRSVLKSIKVAH